MQTSLDQSLKHLGTDYIDLYNLHGVVPQDYAYLVNDIYPALQKAQQQGKIRFVGLSEMFNEDFEHTMLQQALADDLWDVLMVGFNLLNQTARANVFAQAIAQNVGIQIMFAVRKALSHPDNLRAFTDALVEKGKSTPPTSTPFPTSCWPRPHPYPMPPTASAATSPASTSSSPARATPTTSTPTSRLSPARR